MKIAYFSPNAFHNLFLPHVKGTEFLVNKCDRNVDFVYAASLSTLEKAGNAAKIHGKPLVAWIWDIPLERYPGGDAAWRDAYLTDVKDIQWMLKLNMRRLLSGCSLVLCGNLHVKDCLEECGIHANYMPFYIDQDTLFQKPRVDDETFRILQVSRFAPHKNFECAIEALHRRGSRLALAMGKRIRLTTIGFSTGNQCYVKNLVWCAAKRFGGNRRVTAEFLFDAARYEVNAALAQADAFVSASLHEGFGVPAAEAAHMGVPLLLADRPYYTRQYGDRATYFDPNNPDDLANALLTMPKRSNIGASTASGHQLNPKAFAARWRMLINKWLNKSR